MSKQTAEQLDEELKALETIIRTLVGLDADVQRRIMQYLFSRFEVKS